MLQLEHIKNLKHSIAKYITQTEKEPVKWRN